MTTNNKTPRQAPRDLPTLPKELIDQLATGMMSAGEIEDISAALKKALIERALGAELGHHLGYPPGAERPAEAGNQRNGKSSKTVLTGDSPLRLDVPRDRDGSFPPILIPKHERRFTGFDDKIIAMYARGTSVRDIRTFLAEKCGTEVSADFISSVTDGVLEKVTLSQQRPQELMYPVVFFDAGPFHTFVLSCQATKRRLMAMAESKPLFPITGDWVCSQLSPKFEQGEKWVLTFFEVPYPGRDTPELVQLRERASLGPMVVTTSELCEVLEGVPQVWQLDIRNQSNSAIELYIEDGEVFEQHLD